MLCAAVIGTAVLGAAADTASDAFGVGVLRRDGVVIPFATFDGKRWRNAWPEPQSNFAVPVSLASVPRRWWGPLGPLETWQAWLESGEQTIHVTQPDWVNVHCARHLALRTDYSTRTYLPLEGEQPYPKDGLVVSPPRPIDRIEALPPTATELDSLGRVLHEAFNTAESMTAGRGRHPVNRRTRDQTTPALEAAYAFGRSPRYYYIEAMRTYRELGQRADECIATAFGTGWFVRENGQARPLVMAVDVLSCNRFAASYMLPLGVVRVADRLFWLAQFSGSDHERYTVLEIKPKTVDAVVNTWGGGC